MGEEVKEQDKEEWEGKKVMKRWKGRTDSCRTYCEQNF